MVYRVGAAELARLERGVQSRDPEEERDLTFSAGEAVGRVNGVALLALTEEGPNRAGRRLRRICRAHHLAQTLDRVVPLQTAQHHGTGGHIGDQVAEERPLAMLRVELLRFLALQARQARL